MSWHLVLFSSHQKIEFVAEIDETQFKPTDFNTILESHFNKINKEGNYWEIIGEDFTIEFSAKQEKTSNTMLTLYGENGLFQLIELAKMHNWQIYDSRMDGMIDLQNPMNNGFANHRNYVE